MLIFDSYFTGGLKMAGVAQDLDHLHPRLRPEVLEQIVFVLEAEVS